jgi:hypothetical protein
MTFGVPPGLTGAVLLLSLLAGCADSGLLAPEPPPWHPEGVNAHNIALMAAVPSDLAYGRRAPRRSGAAAAFAVERLWQGRPKPLLISVFPRGAPAAQAPGAAP